MHSQLRVEANIFCPELGLFLTYHKNISNQSRVQTQEVNLRDVVNLCHVCNILNLRDKTYLFKPKS